MIKYFEINIFIFLLIFWGGPLILGEVTQARWGSCASKVGELRKQCCLGHFKNSKQSCIKNAPRSGQGQSSPIRIIGLSGPLATLAGPQSMAKQGHLATLVLQHWLMHVATLSNKNIGLAIKYIGLAIKYIGLAINFHFSTKWQRMCQGDDFVECFAHVGVPWRAFRN